MAIKVILFSFLSAFIGCELSFAEEIDLFTLQLQKESLVIAQPGTMENPDEGSYAIRHYAMAGTSPPYMLFKYGVVRQRKGKILSLESLSDEVFDKFCVLMQPDDESDMALAEVFALSEQGVEKVIELNVTVPKSPEELSLIKEKLLKLVSKAK